MKFILRPGKVGTWPKACAAAGIYLLAVMATEMSAHWLLPYFAAEHVEWILFLVTAVLIGFLIQYNLVSLRRRHQKEREITNWLSVIGGEDFFPLLAKNLARSVEADCALICEYTGDGKETLRSLAAFCHGRKMEEFECSWVGTPGEKVLKERRLVCLRSGVKEQFVWDHLPPELAADSFLGIPMFDADGHITGLLALLDNRPLCDREGVEETLQLAAVRAAAELERRHVEEELRQKRDRLHAIITTALDAIIEMDDQGTVTSWNPRAEMIFGWTADEAIDRPLAELIIPMQHRKAHSEGLRHFLATGEGTILNRHIEITALRRGGQEFPVELTVTPIRHKDHYAFAGFLRDITETKQAEQALRFSEARYRALYRDNPTMLATLDTGWTMLSVNPACAGQLGYRIEELEGQSVLKLFHEDDRLAVAEQLQKCLQYPDQVFRWQFRKVRKDGAELWVDELAHAVYELDGSLNVLVVCQDITERKRMEEEIVQLNADLMTRAAELEEANRELETFNYAVAHDLRKPLTIINGYCQVLKDYCGDRLDEKCMNYLHEAYEGTWRMNQLIDTLLNFAQLSRIEPDREAIDFSALAYEVAAELRRAQPNRPGTFHIATGITCNGDASLLRVVLENLLGNAWKYTSKKGEAIIEFGLEELDGKQVYFVRDNGSGFAMTDVAKLFLPFQRLPGSEEYDGHGIGLATVERIIRHHGGRIWAEGEPGRGATFYFTLPAE